MAAVWGKSSTIGQLTVSYINIRCMNGADFVSLMADRNTWLGASWVAHRPKHETFLRNIR